MRFKELNIHSVPEIDKDYALLVKEWLTSGACLSLTPELVAVGWGKRCWLKERRSDGPTFYSPDFFLSKTTAWFYHEHQAVIAKEELRRQLGGALPCKQPQWSPLPRARFEESFDALLPLFRTGALNKAVLYAGQQASFAFDLAQMQTALVSLLDRPGYTYGWWDQQEGILGLTPEILFQTHSSGVINTIACAGTQDAQLPVEAMLTDRKLEEEQQCVVDGIMTALSPFGTVTLGERAVQTYGRLRHFVTPIEVKTRQSVDFEDLVVALHPTQAVGAAPKVAGEAWLRAYQEKVPRGRYGAPFGYWDPAEQSAHCCVAIRNVQWQGAQQQVLAGCGILASSQKEAEWQELQLKLASIKSTLQP